MGLIESGQVLVVDLEDQDAPQRFAASLRDSGFALLTEHGMPTRSIGDITAEWGAIFDSGVPGELCAGEGRSWGYHRPGHGFMPDGTRRDRKDYYHQCLSRPLPPGISGSTNTLSARGVELARQLLGWLDETSPPERWLGARPTSAWISAEQSVLRLQRYLPHDEPSPPGSVRALAHADINLITLLPAPEIPGLQVRTRDGRWADLRYHPDLVIVNVGEMLEAASGGYYPATLHRVVVQDPADSLLPRWSLPMFFHPDDEVVLAPGVTAGGYRANRVAEYRRKGWMVNTGAAAAGDEYRQKYLATRHPAEQLRGASVCPVQ